MKKFLFTMAAAVMAITASAQVYLGGEVGFWRNWDSNKTQFSITPEIGYNLDENWAIGTTIGYSYAYQGSLPVVGNQKMNAFIVEPYARYTFAKFDAVSLFLDGTVGFSTYKYSYEHGDDGDAQNQWEVGVKPGVKVDLTSKLSFMLLMVSGLSAPTVSASSWMATPSSSVSTTTSNIRNSFTR